MIDEFTLSISLPDWSKERLVSVMRRQLSDERRVTSKSKVERYVVNMLRHQHSNYDQRQSTDDFISVVTAIAMKYPWTAAECTRQIAWREKKESISLSRQAA